MKESNCRTRKCIYWKKNKHKHEISTIVIPACYHTCSIFRKQTHTVLPCCFFKALACTEVWMVKLSGCLVQDAASLMEIPVGSVVRRERGVISPLNLGRTF